MEMKNKGSRLIRSLIIAAFLQLAVFTATAQAGIEPPSCSCLFAELPELSLKTPPDSGPMVQLLQEKLVLLGFNISRIDGTYGPETRDAVRMFQTLRGLKPTGVVNTRTWQEIMAAAAEVLEEDVDPGAQASIVIDRARRTLTLYIGGVFHKQYRVAVGKYSTPTPLGEWKIVHRAVNWGSGFGTRWMGLNVPWGIYGIHGTNKPGSIGSYASHGCIRMLNSNAEDLYPYTRLGTPVTIIDSSLPFPPPLTIRQYKPGVSGQNTVYLQWYLKKAGLPIIADGRYGPYTVLMVKWFQAKMGLPVTGTADAGTVSRLEWWIEQMR